MLRSRMEQENIVSWNWNFGDPASGVFNTSNLADPQHIFTTPGFYTVTLYVVNFNNCSDTITKQVNAGVAPPVAFYLGSLMCRITKQFLY
jgi:PKD repeat protein